MINRFSPCNGQPGRPRALERLRGTALAAFGVALAVVGGCAEEEPPPPAAVTRAAPPPAEPPTPKVTPIAQLMTQLRIDERVKLPEDKAPATDPQRVAVLEFFDAFARGDDQSLARMLSLADNLELQDLVESGQWASQVAAIKEIDVVTGTSEFGDCALAVFTVGTAFQAQLWYFEGGATEFTFEAAPQPPGIMDRLSGADWIKAWHDILKEELARADEPDEEYTIPQRNLDESSNSSGGSSAGGGGSAPPPGGGGARPGRKPPSRTPRRPPGG
jgi:hypothetical protein